jgi:hypothetical protein
LAIYSKVPSEKDAKIAPDAVCVSVILSTNGSRIKRGGGRK